MTRLSREDRLEQLLSCDLPFWRQGIRLAGMDEVGRGPLAGCVTAACVVMPSDSRILWVDDSKKLSPSRREKVYEEIIRTSRFVGIGRVEAEEIDRIEQNYRLFLEVNMGATAIGTGINADPDYSPLCIRYLREITGLPVVAATNLIEATNDTGAFIMNSSALKRLATKMSKICNDLRLLSSGPRAGLGEINLPPMQPGSSIMPGKVNPVIPEVVNQVAFRVIGNDLTITIASEAGQLELNVMEPIIVYSLFENIEMLIRSMNTLRDRCVTGITANEETCRRMVRNSIGVVTALNPYLGYETSTELAKTALRTGKGIYDLVLEQGLMSREELDSVLSPENMLRPHKLARR